MRILANLVLALALAPPALADVDFRKDKQGRSDLALLTACFNAAETWEAAHDCVNLTFKGCIGRLGHKPAHVEQAACNIRELALWDHLLSHQERKLEAWAVLKDNEIASKSNRDPFAYETFLKAQEDWNTYRREQCRFDGQQVAGGTAGMTVQPHCEMGLVVERMFTLRPLLREITLGKQP